VSSFPGWLTRARNPDTPLESRLDTLFELLAVRLRLDQDQREQLGHAEREIAQELGARGPVRTTLYEYRLDRDGRIKRVLPV
jgi:hypothetical protein